MAKLFISGLLSVFFCILSLAQSRETDAWGKDIRRFEHLDSMEAYPVNAVLFAGSSSIRLWSTLADDMAPYPVIQRGYGGARLSDFSVFAARIIYPHPVSAIVLFIANDITGTAADKTPEEVRDLFLHVLGTIRQKFPETPVFWVAVTPTGLRWKVWPEIEKANELIEKECNKQSNTYFISTKKYFLTSSGIPNDQLFLSDRLHLNKKGYAVWSGIIKGELDRVIGNRKSVIGNQ
jgi:lysophospholipase L1-like esterase